MGRGLGVRPSPIGSGVERHEADRTRLRGNAATARRSPFISPLYTQRCGPECGIDGPSEKSVSSQKLGKGGYQPPWIDAGLARCYAESARGQADNRNKREAADRR